MKATTQAITQLAMAVLLSLPFCCWTASAQEEEDTGHFFDDNPAYFFEPFEREVNARYKISLKEATELPDGVRANDFWHFWYALPKDTMTQTRIGEINFSIEPTGIFEDQNGNSIAYWNFADTGTLDLEFSFKLKTRNVLNSIDPALVGEYDRSSEEYLFYTRSGRLIQSNDEIIGFAAEIRAASADAENPYILAKEAFKWVMDHMAYAKIGQLNRDRGISFILGDPYTFGDLNYYKGDCGSYSFLYNSILRTLGIPARMAVGGWSDMDNQYHVWSEVLIPGYGWIPADTSAADVFVYDEGEELNALGTKMLTVFPALTDPMYYFSNIDPFRYVTSIGSEIEMQPTVDWDFSEYMLSWYFFNGHAGIMQIGTFNLLLDSDYQLSFEEN